MAIRTVSVVVLCLSVLATQAAAQRSRPSLEQLLREAPDSPSSAMRLWYLREFRRELPQILRRAKPPVQLAILGTMGARSGDRVGGPATLKVVRGLMRSRNKHVRRAAVSVSLDASRGDAFVKLAARLMRSSDKWRAVTALESVLEAMNGRWSRVPELRLRALALQGFRTMFARPHQRKALPLAFFSDELYGHLAESLLVQLERGPRAHIGTLVRLLRNGFSKADGVAFSVQQQRRLTKALQRVLKQRSPDAWEATFSLLQRVKPPLRGVAPMVRSLLSAKLDSSMLGEAIEALAHIGDPSLDEKRFVRLLDHRSRRIVRKALRALVDRKLSAGSLKNVCDKLARVDWANGLETLVRIDALGICVERLPLPDATKLARVMLTSNHIDLRNDALKAISESPRVSGALLGEARKLFKDPRTRRRALIAIGGAGAVPGLRPLVTATGQARSHYELGFYVPHMRIYGAKAIAMLTAEIIAGRAKGPDTLIPQFAKIAPDSPATAKAIVRIVRKFPKLALQALATLKGVRVGQHPAIAEIARRVLSEQLGHKPSRWETKAALESLGRVPPRYATPLRKLIIAKIPQFPVAATKALSAVSGYKAKRVLRGLVLFDGDVQVSTTAIIALFRRGDFGALRRRLPKLPRLPELEPLLALGPKAWPVLSTSPLVQKAVFAHFVGGARPRKISKVEGAWVEALIPHAKNDHQFVRLVSLIASKPGAEKWAERLFGRVGATKDRGDALVALARIARRHQPTLRRLLPQLAGVFRVSSDLLAGRRPIPGPRREHMQRRIDARSDANHCLYAARLLKRKASPIVAYIAAAVDPRTGNANQLSSISSYAVQTLEEIATPSALATKKLTPMLSDASDVVRRLVSSALSTVGSKAAVAALRVSFEQDVNCEVRTNAFVGLARLRSHLSDWKQIQANARLSTCASVRAAAR